MPLQFEPITDPLFLDLIRIGRIEGEAKALIRLVERRFGPLPAAVRERILAADSTMVEGWLDRLMEAPSLDAVFADRPVN
jgi:hypothetical protein